MKLERRPPRRKFFTRTAAVTSAVLLGGCDSLSRSEWFPKVLNSVSGITESVAKAVAGRKSMAEEFAEADRSPTFRSNGSDDPGTPKYEGWVATGFKDYRLSIGGMVAQPRAFTMDELRAMPARTQITRHDCVEGWSAIAKWKGVPLASLLAAVQPKPEARYAVFYCADPMGADNTDFYYESIDLDDAFHTQTLLAYDLNGQPLPVSNGAPLRLRVERQLGYKQAKYIRAIELVESFANIRGGKGGYWEDEGYEWYAGI